MYFHQHSHSSMELIRERSKQIIEAHNLFIMDDVYEYRDCNIPDNFNAYIWGNYLEQIYRSTAFHFKNISLLFLSPQVQNVVQEIYGLNKTQTQAINRYDLFLNNTKDINIDFEGVDFVYSGRICPDKNIDFLLHFISILQTDFNVKCRLYLIGDFDNATNPLWDYSEENSYQSKIKKIVDKLKWTSNPVFMEKLDSKKWMKCKEFKNPMLINFSTSIFEDFGVSVAQAQEEGWPVLLSDWSAFKDVDNNSSIKLPVNFISPGHMPAQWLHHKAHLAIQYIMNNDFLTKQPDNHQHDTLLVTLNKMSKTNFNEKISYSTRSYFPDILLLQESKHDVFFRSVKGDLISQKLYSLLGQNENNIVINFEAEAKINHLGMLPGDITNLNMTSLDKSKTNRLLKANTLYCKDKDFQKFLPVFKTLGLVSKVKNY